MKKEIMGVMVGTAFILSLSGLGNQAIARAVSNLSIDTVKSFSINDKEPAGTDKTSINFGFTRTPQNQEGIPINEDDGDYEDPCDTLVNNCEDGCNDMYNPGGEEEMFIDDPYFDCMGDCSDAFNECQGAP